jgi:hypothetical protein
VFSVTGSTTLDLNGKTVTAAQGLGIVSGGTPAITMSSGTIVLTGGGLASGEYVWNTTYPVTFTGSGTISCTSSSVTYIGPAGRTLPTINQGGTGLLEFEDDGTGTGYVLADITSTATSNTTIRLTPGVTTTFTNFSLSGTATSQVTLTNGGALPPFYATISKASGTVNVNYLDIQGIAATGGATWNAITVINGGTNNDLGNNTGWNFTGGGTSVTVNVTGVEGVCAVGVGTVVANANAPPTGVSANGSVGDVTVAAKANVSLTGVQATGSVGDVTVAAKANVTLTGVEATGSVGTLDATGKANTTLTGIEASGTVGTATVSITAIIAPDRFDNQNSFFTATLYQYLALFPPTIPSSNQFFPLVVYQGAPTPNWHRAATAGSNSFTGIDMVVNPSWARVPTSPTPSFTLDNQTAVPDWNPQ